MTKRNKNGSTARDFLEGLILPPKCYVCGEIMNVEHNQTVLCEKCLEKWNGEREKECERCLKTAQFCKCGTTYGKSNLISSFSSCIMYESEFSKQAIAQLKYKGYRKYVKFLARQLLNNIYMTYDLDFSNCIIAYPPRSLSSRIRYGFDHAKLLAEETAKMINVPVFYGIRHKGKSEQKYLDFKNRGKNAFASFYIKNKEEAKNAVKGKTVILIDDVITSGATGVCIAALLHNCGAECVRLFTVGKTTPYFTRK